MSNTSIDTSDPGTEPVVITQQDIDRRHLVDMKIDGAGSCVLPGCSDDAHTYDITVRAPRGRVRLMLDEGQRWSLPMAEVTGHEAFGWFVIADGSLWLDMTSVSIMAGTETFRRANHHVAAIYEQWREREAAYDELLAKVGA